MSAADRIDVVFPFVDGSVEGFRDDYRSVVGKDPSACQVRSFGEARYALRSIAEHMPWVGEIFFVVRDEAQLPDWLDASAVRVILHRDFLPPEVGDCFSPYPLQAWAAAIPGLSDRYVLWSDDKFVLRSSRRADFFLPSGRPRVPLFAADPFESWDDESPFMRRVATGFRALKQLAEEKGLESGGHLPLVSHLPFPVEKRLWNAFLDDLLEFEGFCETIFSGVRDPLDGGADRMVVTELWPAWLWLTGGPEEKTAWWTTRSGRVRRWLERKRILPRGMLKVGIRNDPELTRRALRRIRTARPWFVCINDDAYDPYVDPEGVNWGGSYTANPVSVELLLDFLQSRFPRLSRFERSGPQGLTQG